MKRNAFTLVELLVVIALVALLATLLMPSLTAAMSKYRDVQCRNNLNEIWKGFVLACDPAKGTTAVLGASASGEYPTAWTWPSIPRNVVENIELYACPEDEIKQASVTGSLRTVEYESPYGYYPLDTIGNGNCYKSRRGRDARGPYTEYIMQDDEGTGGQYAQMSFNGWIDTDGGARIYDDGAILIFSNLIEQTSGSVPAWTNNHGPGWPNRINTCGNTNSIRYMGEPSLTGNGRMQSARGQTFTFPNWGENLTNYGMNTYAYKYRSGDGCIVLVDYQETAVNVDNPVAAEGMLLDSARHSGKVNALRSDGSIKSASPLEISPLLHPGAWRP
ncbi:MAG: prepilin-type N-terminal cleavage/methylation domain-containing protein [bacterium]|nr:prepilin-type N-terminal cleavage/methylation domain-containing protein [bacterium]